jgi:hypothetical protein
MEPGGSLRHSQQSATCPYIKPAQTSPSPLRIYWRSILILYSDLRLPLPNRLSLRYPHKNPVCTSPLPLPCHMPLPAHSSWFYHPNNIWWREQIIKLLITQCSPLPCYLAPLRPNVFLGTLFSNTLSLCSFLSVRDQLSHPYKTTTKLQFCIY